MPECVGEKEATRKGYRIPSEGLASILKDHFYGCWEKRRTYEDYAKDIIRQTGATPKVLEKGAAYRRQRNRETSRGEVENKRRFNKQNRRNNCPKQKKIFRKPLQGVTGKQKIHGLCKKSRSEGYAQAAKLFRAAAEAETVHALNHLKELGGIKSTKENSQKP